MAHVLFTSKITTNRVDTVRRRSPKTFCAAKILENIFLKKIFRVYLIITIMVTRVVEDDFTDSWCDICLNFPYCFDKTKQTKSHGLDNGEYSYRSAPRSLLEVLLSQQLAFTGSSRGDVGTFKNIKTTLETSLCTSVLFCSSSSLASSSALNTFASQPQPRSPMVKPDAR